MSQERAVYRDIVQEAFVDSYANATLKSVMAFRWARTFCPHAKYVLIANDDVVVDVFKLVPYLETLHKNNEDLYQFSLCYLYPCCMLVDQGQGQSQGRNDTRRVNTRKRIRLRVEELERAYRGKAYPAHCSGTVTVAPSLTIHNLYLMSLDTPSFVPADPWIGVLSEKLGISFRDTSGSFVGMPAEPTLLHHFGDPGYLETPILTAVVGPSHPGKESETVRRIWGLIIAQHRDRPPMDVHQYMGMKRETDTHIYTVAAAAACIDLAVIALIGYIIFCRKKMRPYLQHPLVHHHS